MDLSSSWPYIEEIAKNRLSHNIGKWHADEFGTKIEVMGAAGELAARRFLGLDEELHEHFDGGADFVYKGFRVDVKTTHWTRKARYRNLQWRATKPINCDIIFFVVVNMDTKQAIPVGFATGDEMRRAPINQERHHPCHEIAVPELHNLWELTLGKTKT